MAQYTEGGYFLRYGLGMRGVKVWGRRMSRGGVYTKMEEDQKMKTNSKFITTYYYL